MAEVAVGCSRGAVWITVQEQPLRLGLCRCIGCRKHHRALFGASASFAKTAVTFTGEPRSYLGCHFCPVCGCPVFS